VRETIVKREKFLKNRAYGRFSQKDSDSIARYSELAYKKLNSLKWSQQF